MIYSIAETDTGIIDRSVLKQKPQEAHRQWRNLRSGEKTRYWESVPLAEWKDRGDNCNAYFKEANTMRKRHFKIQKCNYNQKESIKGRIKERIKSEGRK